MGKSSITHIPIEGGSGKIRTGAMQFENDWPGLFIRGDDCIALLAELKLLKEWLSIKGRKELPRRCEEIGRIINDDVIVRKQQERPE